MDINLDAYEDIHYCPCFIAFLDVLGFRNLVMSKNNNEREKICQYLGIVNSAIDYLKGIPKKSDIKAVVISDSVILSMPKKNSVDQDRDLFRHLCIAVGLIQQNLAKKNLWIRGGISGGDAYFDEIKKQIIGPGYVQAYEIEEKYADTPRVIIDSKIINELGCKSAGNFINVVNKEGKGGIQYSNWSSRVLFYWNQELFDSGIYIPQDIPLFIDYLSPNVGMNISDIKLVIKNLTKNTYKELEYYSKYRWVINYLKSIYRYQDERYQEVEEMLINL